MILQRSLGAVHWILGRERHLFDVAIGLGAFAGSPPQQVPILAFRISTYHQKVGISAQVFVGDPRWKDEDIPGFDIERCPFGTAKLNASPSPRHTEHLVGGAVVVVIRENAVPPQASPVVRLEYALKGAGSALYGLPEEEDGQRRIVREGPVVRKLVRLDVGLPEDPGKRFGNRRRHRQTDGDADYFEVVLPPRLPDLACSMKVFMHFSVRFCTKCPFTSTVGVLSTPIFTARLRSRSA